jgi:alpha-D-ribose 1-methylphosphonate 5-phosphate C-P lyase
MNESRTKRYRPGRLPRQKRTLSIFGAASYVDGRVVKDQSDKIYRCWNCGFICNEQHQKKKEEMVSDIL